MAYCTLPSLMSGVKAALAAIEALAPCAKRLFAVRQGEKHAKALLQLFKQQGDQQLRNSDSRRSCGT